MHVIFSVSNACMIVTTCRHPSVEIVPGSPHSASTDFRRVTTLLSDCTTRKGWNTRSI